MAVVDKPVEVSEQVLNAVKNGQEAALDAVRTFMATVDKALPAHGDGPSKRQEIIDGGLAMAERLVQSQHDFIRNVVGGAASAVGATSSKAE